MPPRSRQSQRPPKPAPLHAAFGTRSEFGALDPDAPMRWGCSLKGWNCCVDKAIPVRPYDMLRLRHALEVPSPVAGTLTRVLAKEGETVPMGHPICDIETSDSPFEAASVGAEEDTTGRLIEATGVVGPTGVLEEGAEPDRSPRASWFSSNPFFDQIKIKRSQKDVER